MSVVKKRQLNIGTIGHVDHGKTTLTSAITKVLSEAYKDIGNKSIGYADIDKSPEERARGVTIKQTTVQYFTPKTCFAHIDCPGHADYVKNMIVGSAQMDLAILLVSAVDGPEKQTKEHVLLAKQIGVKRIVVFINKCDMLAPEDREDMIDLVKDEVKDLLKKYSFIRDEDSFREDDTMIFCGSALGALEGKPEYVQVILDMYKAIDENVPDARRDLDGTFLMAIDQKFSIKGRGTVVTGLIEKGVIKLNEEIEIVGGRNGSLKTMVTGVEAFHKAMDKAEAGENVGLLLRGVVLDDVDRGQVMCAPGTVKVNNNVKAEIYFLTEHEGGRSTPVHSGYRPQFFVRTGDFTGIVTLEGGKEVALPGDRCSVTVQFENKIPINIGDRFAVREGGKTICSGIVIEASVV